MSQSNWATDEGLLWFPGDLKDLKTMDIRHFGWTGTVKKHGSISIKKAIFLQDTGFLEILCGEAF